MQRTALVTGGNRGIGFEICRRLGRAGLSVVLAARDADRGAEAASRLRAQGLDVYPERLDVTDRASVEACAERLRAAGVAVDVLVNNAGVYPTQPFFEVPEAVMRDSLEVNLLGAFHTCQVFIPGMVRRRYGRVVNVSSSLGRMCEEGPGDPAYGIAKAALNALTRVVAATVPGDVKVNAADPGWVRTKMGRPRAPRSPEQGADTIVWLATPPADGPSDGFIFDRRPLSW